MASEEDLAIWELSNSERPKKGALEETKGVRSHPPG